MRAVARALVQRLQEAGYEAGWVGGCVRDLLLGHEPKDYDVATSARPDAIEALFKRTIPVGRKFGVLLVAEKGHTFEVATFRTEEGYGDGRRPDRVTYADARADVSRRDFTVNGLFYDPVAEKLWDWVGGEADVRARRLRTIGDPSQRFAEDHLRLLRAVRFAAQLGFDIEPDTWTALRGLTGSIGDIAAERVREELLRLWRPPHAGRGLRLIQESGLLREILPEIEAFVRCEQSPDYHPEGTLFEHVVRMFDHLPDDATPELPWVVLLHDVGKPRTAQADAATGRIRFPGHERVGADLAREILTRLRFPRRFIDDVVTAVQYHMQLREGSTMRRSTLRRMLSRATFDLELELHRLDCLGSHGRLAGYEWLKAERARLHEERGLPKPLLSGEDLKGMGVRPGPRMGVLLAEVRELQLEDELRTPAEARAWVARRLLED
jgi:poly(A) polymerase